MTALAVRTHIPRIARVASRHPMAANGFRCRFVAIVSAYDQPGGCFAERESFFARPGAPPPHTVANISLRRAEFRKANFDGAARGQLCDRNVRDDFTQPSNSPDHGIKPVWRAINGAVPLAAEGHHFALELIEPAAMQDTLLFI